MRRALALLVAVLALGACTYKAQVPIVDGADLANVGAREPGRFAAMVQTGGWNLETKVTSFNCSAHTYEADLNGSWGEAMQTALKAALEHVDFVPATIPSKELGTKGYDAQIGVMQTNASSNMAIVPHFFTGSETSSAQLEGVLTIGYPDGTQQQQPLAGQGSATVEIGSCGNVEAIGQAAAHAIEDIVRKATLTAKLLLAQHQAKAAANR